MLAAKHSRWWVVATQLVGGDTRGSGEPPVVYS
jgi:hypothetical protein